MESALTTKCQATIPKAIRKHLHVGPGDRIKFFVHPDGTVVILPKISASALKGLVPAAKRRHASLKQMNEGIAAAAAAGLKRGKRR